MLEELQSLSEKNKHRILIIATIIIMVIVVSIWLLYVGSIIAGSSQQSASQAASTNAVAPAAVPVVAPTAMQASGPSMWQNVGNWFGFVFSSIANIFRKPSQYNIQPQNN